MQRVIQKELGVQLEPYASATGARVTGFSSRPGQLEQARVPLGARIIKIDESSVACETFESIVRMLQSGKQDLFALSKILSF